jgi:hypothetical protein
MAAKKEDKELEGLIQVHRLNELIADFEEDFTKDWFFAVLKSFRDVLDIKYTPVAELVMTEGEIQYKEIVDIRGFTRKIRETNSTREWTQGPYYCFDKGQIIYDTPKAYIKSGNTITKENGVEWKESVKHIKIICEVVRSTPNRFNDQSNNWTRVYRDEEGYWWAKQKIDPKLSKKEKEAIKDIPLGKSLREHMNGQVTFKLSKPINKTIELETIGQYYLSQFEFIDFLRTGISSAIDVRDLKNTTSDGENSQKIVAKQTVLPF